MSVSSETTGKAPASDAGAVAARLGFKYQDHVAAFFVLTMLGDERLTCVECETADDITLRWKTNDGEFSEYVQVKTTEDNKKWTQAEILTRALPKKPTSLVEKSLLCDSEGKSALFRIVSCRDINRSLTCLKRELSARKSDTDCSDLGTKLRKKWPTVSAGGRDLAYWAEHTVWQVAPDMEFLSALNYKKLAILAERHGANPTASHADTIYQDLLRKVDDAAVASRVSASAEKLISRSAALDWWQDHMKATEAATLKTSKPYRATTEKFLADLHSITEADILRALSSFDVRYEKEQWRSGQLADHLLSWLPELALKASDLASVQHLRLRQKTRDAIAAIKRNRSVTPEELLGETLLHVVVRQAMGSEPIACKLFVQGSGELRSFKNAHIVHTSDRDELWLGRAALALASSYTEIVTQTMVELDRALDTDLLKDERQTILALREPTHLLPTTLEAALSNGAPIDDLIAALCIPVLIAYDSQVLAGGYIAEYRAQLIEEVTNAYAALKSELPGGIKAVKVHIFLIPIECVRTLTTQFTDLLAAS